MARPLVEDFLCLDIRKLEHHACLRPGVVFRYPWPADIEDFIAVNVESGLVVSYLDEQRNRQEYYIGFTFTPCNYGGQCRWFLCPLCGGRCRKLYFGNGASILGCRSCYRLAYASQRISPYWASWERYLKLSEQYSVRPKGMHRKTWLARLNKAQAVAEEHRRMMMPVRVAQLMNSSGTPREGS